MKKERAKIPVPEEEYYTLFGYPVTKEELNHAGRELSALGWDAASLNEVTASWPPPKLSRKEVSSLQKQARILLLYLMRARGFTLFIQPNFNETPEISLKFIHSSLRESA